MSSYPDDERTIGDEPETEEESPGSDDSGFIRQDVHIGTTDFVPPSDVPTSSNAGATEVATSAGTTEVATKGYKSVSFKVEVPKDVDISTYSTGVSVLKDELGRFTTSAEAREMKKNQVNHILGEISKLRIINERVIELQKVETKNKPKKEKPEKTLNTEIDIILRFSYNGILKSLTTTLGATIGDVRKKVGELFKVPKKDWTRLALNYGDFVLTHEVNTRCTLGGETLKVHKNIHLKADDLITVPLTN